MAQTLQALTDFHNHPGLYFVWATLSPLISFIFLLILGGLRLAGRSMKSSALGNLLFRALGGDRPRRTGAYVATAAIALSFILSTIGGTIHYKDSLREHAAHAESHTHGHDHHDGHNDAKHEKKHGDEHAVAHRWEGSITWASLNLVEGLPAPDGEEARGKPQHNYATTANRLMVGYRIDTLTVIMFMMVTFIATLIHLFSAGYMAEELQPIVEDHHVHTADGHLHRRGRFGRFFLFLSLFCFSMLNLVLADNLFQVFVSWELVGICSYLLVGFYYERTSASNAANKAFITNRVGDAGFILGLLILWSYVGTFNFEEIFQHLRAPTRDTHGQSMTLAAQFVRVERLSEEGSSETHRITPQGDEIVLFQPDAHIDNENLQHGKAIEAKATPDPKVDDFGTMPYWLLVAAGLGIFLGCMGKSAQFPLHVWLPDAMEGPTPVSALIHAATMVAAGVYLVGRCFPLFTPESRLVIAYVGGITLFMAATIAIVVTDIKKVLAYSTVSQLGYMMLALGVGGWMAGMFHLLTHAFFKALLFLCSGSVIYGCHHEQEMGKMGGLYPKMKITALSMLMGVLAIAGTPLFSGWYSKDAILAQALGFVTVHRQHMLLFLLPLVTAGITTFYMFRMWFMTFTGEPRDQHVHEHAHESPRLMTTPLIILAVCSVCVAWGWPLHDAESSFLGQRLHHAQPAHVLADFGVLAELDEHLHWEGGPVKDIETSERYWGLRYHSLAEALALLAGLLGFTFAALIYYFRVFDAAEAKESFPGLHRFLWNKWYFDELYSVMLVRPALAAARWCKSFDTLGIDGFLHWTARSTVTVSRASGWFDLKIVDGLVNLTARVIFAVGGALRGVQTGSLRGYVLFLALAVIGIFAALTYFVSMAVAR